MMKDISSPARNDVLSGRGNFANLHEGNQFFRFLTQQYKVEYVTGTKETKRVIAEVIVKTIRSLTPPGRFLKRDPKTKLYYDIGDKKAYAKASQALREGAPRIMEAISPKPTPEPSKPSIVSEPQDKNGRMEEAHEIEAKERTEPAESRKLANMNGLLENNAPKEVITDTNNPTVVASTPEIVLSHDVHCVGASMRNLNSLNGFQSVELLKMPRGMESFGIESFKDLSKNLDEIFDEKSFMQSSINLVDFNSFMSSSDVEGISFMREKIMRKMSMSLDKFCCPPVSHDSKTKLLYDVRDKKECFQVSLDLQGGTDLKMSNEIGSFGVGSFRELSKSLDKVFDENMLQSSSTFENNENSTMSITVFEDKKMGMSEKIIHDLSLSLSSFCSFT